MCMFMMLLLIIVEVLLLIIVKSGRYYNFVSKLNFNVSDKVAVFGIRVKVKYLL